MLEIGCGRGGNLLPMAAGLPGVTFVGVDRSARQIDEATRVAGEAGVGNVSFRCADFADLETNEAFDHVIAHGVWSWVSPEARATLFRVIHGVLAPRGIAYVSFNVLPGWYERLGARDFLRHLASPATARTSLADLVAMVSPEQGAYRAALGRVGARLAEADLAYVTHEYFAREHHPELVSTFLDEASAAGLRYLGDAVPQETAFELLPPALLDVANRTDVRQAQQWVDFVRNTSFRRALLVRADAERDGPWTPTLDARALDAMSVTSRLVPTEHAGEYLAGATTVQVSSPAREMLEAIARVAPCAARIDPRWRDELFDLWLATNAVDLHVLAPVLASTPDAAACPVARWHAQHGGPVTNRWHQEVVFGDDLPRRVLARLDGARTNDDIARELGVPNTLVRLAREQLFALALLA